MSLSCWLDVIFKGGSLQEISALKANEVPFVI